MSIWPEIDEKDRRLWVTPQERENSTLANIGIFFVDLKSAPDENAGLDAQLLYGETVRVLSQNKDWAKVVSQLRSPDGRAEDHYVGWIRASALLHTSIEPTHKVMAPRTFLYPAADMKLPRTGYRSMGSLVRVTDFVETRGTEYAILQSGEAVIRRHLVSIEHTEPDYVSVAEKLIYAPYLWGGNTGFGVDCSGLVQLAMRMAGREVCRDTDMQAATLGTPIEMDGDWEKLERGDLVFWRGHVAIAQGKINASAHLIHANGHTMDVTSEPAGQAIERIAHLYERPIGVRRLTA